MEFNFLRQDYNLWKGVKRYVDSFPRETTVIGENYKNRTI